MKVMRDELAQIRVLRLKLKSIGVPLMAHEHVQWYNDDQGVVKNTSVPESTLSKKHNSINYHKSAAAGILRI